MGSPNLPIPYVLTWPTVYYAIGNDKELFREDGLLFLPKGSGVLLPNGPRYRVADTWLSFDKHGHFGLGMHVFLEEVEEGSEGDTLQRLAPDYFR